MFDTMTITKTGAGLFGALLIFLLGNWAADALYSTEAGGHGGEEHVQGYHIDTGDAGHAEAEVVEEVSLTDLLAAADADKGAKVFGKCKACHKLEDGANGTGPHLFAVVDRAVGSIGGFGYSPVVAAMGGNWDLETLNAFLENPKAVAPGTKMTFTGLKKPADRANLIAYLATIGGDGLNLAPAMETEAPAAEEPAAEEATTEEPAAEAPAEEAAAAPAADDTAMAQPAAGDAAKGAKVFNKCKACHKLEDGAKGVGPDLFAILGRGIATEDGFKYSPVLSGMDGIWDAATLDAFLAKPKDFAPGTKMTFTGLKKEADRANLIAYLESIGG